MISELNNIYHHRSPSVIIFLKNPLAVSANFKHVTIEACRQEHGKESVGGMSMDHEDKSMEMGQWGNFLWLSFVKRSLFLVVFCQKKFFMEMGQWRNFFLVVFCQNFLWRRDSETCFSFCLLSTWRQERGDGTVWQFFCCLFVIIRKLSLLSKKIYHMISVLNNIKYYRCPSVIICEKLIPLAVSANFKHVTMVACRQENGNGSVGEWA